jgi:hypothetical protein
MNRIEIAVIARRIKFLLYIDSLSLKLLYNISSMRSTFEFTLWVNC